MFSFNFPRVYPEDWVRGKVVEPATGQNHVTQVSDVKNKVQKNYRYEAYCCNGRTTNGRNFSFTDFQISFLMQHNRHMYRVFIKYCVFSR